MYDSPLPDARWSTPRPSSVVGEPSFHDTTHLVGPLARPRTNPPEHTVSTRFVCEPDAHAGQKSWGQSLREITQLMSLPRLSFSLSSPCSREANGFSASSAGSAMPWLGGSGAVAGRACAFAVDSRPGRVVGKPNFPDIVLLAFVSLHPTARLPFLSSTIS